MRGGLLGSVLRFDGWCRLGTSRLRRRRTLREIQDRTDQQRPQSQKDNPTKFNHGRPFVVNAYMEVRTLRVSIGTTECADSYKSQSSCQSAFRCGELPHFIGAKDDTHEHVHRLKAPACCQVFTVCASIVRCWNHRPIDERFGIFPTSVAKTCQTHNRPYGGLIYR
jgi:hypothetical protein